MNLLLFSYFESLVAASQLDRALPCLMFSLFAGSSYKNKCPTKQHSKATQLKSNIKKPPNTTKAKKSRSVSGDTIM